MWYSSWLISSAAWSWDWYSAAIHTSAASSTIFLPISCTPASTRTTVEELGSRPATLAVSSAKRLSKDLGTVTAVSLVSSLSDLSELSNAIPLLSSDKFVRAQPTVSTAGETALGTASARSRRSIRSQEMKPMTQKP